MKTQPISWCDASPRIHRQAPKTAVAVIAGLLLGLTPSIAAPPSSPPPPTPISSSTSQLAPGVNYTVLITGATGNNRVYIERKGNTYISAAFSGTGILVTGITNVNDTTLTLSFTVASGATLGDRSLTITNADGQSATSALGIVRIVDRPVITAATITPTVPSCADPLNASVTTVTNLDGSPVTFSYQWFENGVANGYTSSTLPASATASGKSYSCIITAAKGTVTGNSFTVGPVLIPDDITNNGILDEWEIQYFGSVTTDPNADSDGDGLSNRAEFLFGLNPTDKQSNKPIKETLKKSTGKFSYSRSLIATGVSYKVWTSTDLANWTEQAGITESQVSSTSEAEVVEVQLPVGLTNNSKLFIRVSAE